MRVRDRFPFCAVVMFTATGDQDKAVEAMKTGLDDYVVKRRDHQYTRLIASLRVAMERRQQKRALEVTNDNLLAAVEEKNVLLDELYHRLSNTLQLIIALNTLAGERVGDPACRSVLQGINDRIHALAALQERLYRTKDLSKVEFGSHLQALAESMVQTQRPRISLSVEAERVDLPVSTAIPLTLLANEFIANAVKHAFPENRAGTISVVFGRESGALVLRVADDGVGFDRRPPSDSMGMHLARRLSAQIKAALEFPQAAAGTTVALRIPFAS
jgi:two-component sensor histidine kinase